MKNTSIFNEKIVKDSLISVTFVSENDNNNDINPLKFGNIAFYNGTSIPYNKPIIFSPKISPVFYYHTSGEIGKNIISDKIYYKNIIIFNNIDDVLNFKDSNDYDEKLVGEEKYNKIFEILIEIAPVDDLKAVLEKNEDLDNLVFDEKNDEIYSIITSDYLLATDKDTESENIKFMIKDQPKYGNLFYFKKDHNYDQERLELKNIDGQEKIQSFSQSLRKI